MLKQLGMFASFLLLGATALVGAGCSTNRCCAPAPVCVEPCQPVCPEPYLSASSEPCRPFCPEPSRPVCPPSCPPACKPVCPPACKPVCPEPCKPVCQPVCPPSCPPACKPVCAPARAPACEPSCKPIVKCCHPSSNKLECLDGITVTAANPKMCMLGDQYSLDFDIHACDDVCDVVVTTHLPDGVSYMRSQPEALVEGSKLTWNIGSMSKGECIAAKVWVKCECEGELCACFCATATPVRFCSLLCAKPILTCEKCGPEQVCPGDPINYSITVSNRGSCNAEDVVVTDNLPDGVEHSSCLRTLTFKLGTLAPCESKTVNICTTAVKRGKVCNTAVVTACNADSSSCQWCTCICCCDVDLVKTGPKEVAIGKNADYQIVVTNTGDLPLTEVVITDTAPGSTSIVSANGATVNGNQAVWRIRELKPNEKATMALTLTTCVPGCFANRAGVTTCQGCKATDEISTRWRGRPAFCVQFCDTEDPICIGEHTSYIFTVTNQGSESDDNVVVTFRFPKEIKPLSATGDTPGSISGQTVTFAPFNNIRPRQSISFRVDAEAMESGDARVTAEVSSDTIKTPIVQQESTIVN